VEYELDCDVPAWSVLGHALAWEEVGRGEEGEASVEALGGSSQAMDGEPAHDARAATSPNPGTAKVKNATEAPVRSQDGSEEEMVGGGKGHEKEEAADGWRAGSGV